MDTIQYDAGRFTKNKAIPKELAECQDMLKKSLSVYSDSLREGEIVQAYVEGEHYNMKILEELREAGRPPEYYNLILRISRLLSGYFTKVVTTVMGEPVVIEDTETVNVHNEHFKLVQRLSSWDSVVEEIVGDMITLGQGAWQLYVEDTGRKDFLGRPIRDIRIAHIDARRVLLDPKADLPDKSDARFIHLWEYMSISELETEFGKEKAGRVKFTHEGGYEDWLDYSDNSLFRHWNSYDNWRDGEEFVIIRTYRKKKVGEVTIVTETTWHGDELLGTKELDIQMFPVQAITVMEKKTAGSAKRYYSPLIGAIPSQDAINQALLQFQKLVGESRVIADNKALRNDEVDEFNKKLKTISEVLFVRNLQGIKIEKLTGEAQAHINKMYTSIQLIMEVIGINEAFLGQSKAGDSGRKFEGQRSASENTLSYLATPINLAYKQMYIQTIHYADVYKQAEEYLRFEDEFGQSRWALVNEPFVMPTGEVDEDGDPVLEYVKHTMKNPITGKTEEVYVNERAKSLSQIAVEVQVHTAPYDDADSVEMAFLEGLLNGTAGNIIASAHPAGIPYLYSLATKHLKTKNSEKIAMYLRQLSEQLGNLPMDDPRLYGNKSQGAMSNGGQGNAVNSGSSELGTQGAVQGTQSRQIQHQGGTDNDNKPEGYNRPKGEQQ